MSVFDDDILCFIVLATFERGTDDLGVLPEHVAGACGWLGVRVAQEEDVVAALDQELAEVGLHLVEIDRIVEVHSLADVATHDEHLSTNMASWQAGRLTVWGTIHSYMGHGEA